MVSAELFAQSRAAFTDVVRSDYSSTRKQVRSAPRRLSTAWRPITKPLEAKKHCTHATRLGSTEALPALCSDLTGLVRPVASHAQNASPSPPGRVGARVGGIDEPREGRVPAPAFREPKPMRSFEGVVAGVARAPARNVRVGATAAARAAKPEQRAGSASVLPSRVAGVQYFFASRGLCNRTPRSR